MFKTEVVSMTWFPTTNETEKSRDLMRSFGALAETKRGMDAAFKPLEREYWERFEMISNEFWDLYIQWLRETKILGEGAWEFTMRGDPWAPEQNVRFDPLHVMFVHVLDDEDEWLERLEIPTTALRGAEWSIDLDTIRFRHFGEKKAISLHFLESETHFAVNLPLLCDGDLQRLHEDYGVVLSTGRMQEEVVRMENAVVQARQQLLLLAGHTSAAVNGSNGGTG